MNNTMHKKRNILQLLYQRQLDGQLHEMVITRTIFTSNVRKLDKCYSKQLQSMGSTSLKYDGNLYLSNNKQWFQGCFHDNMPHFLDTNLYNVANSEMIKSIKGMIRYQSPKTNVNDTNGLSNCSYNECLFVLTSTAYLIQYLLHGDKWIFHQSIFLSTHFSFEYIEYDIECERFALKSKKFPRKTQQPDVIYYFALFSVAPLSFMGIFSITKSMFGNVNDCYITNGLLVLLINFTYYFYDLEEIVLLFPTQQFLLGSLTNHFTEELNIIIKNKPKLLYKISGKRLERISGFSFGGYPWNCLVNRDYSTDFMIERICDKKTFVSFHENKDNDDLFNEKHTFYHSDGSGHILCIGHDLISCVKLSPNDLCNDIKILFTISFKPEKHSIIEEQKVSRYGRQRTTLQNTSNEIAESRIIHAVDFDDILDMIAVLYTKAIIGAENSYVIGFYDNQNGKLIREIYLKEKVSEQDDHIWQLYTSQLVVICIVGSVVRRVRPKCLIYQLTAK